MTRSSSKTLPSFDLEIDRIFHSLHILNNTSNSNNIGSEHISYNGGIFSHTLFNFDFEFIDHIMIARILREVVAYDVSYNDLCIDYP